VGAFAYGIAPGDGISPGALGLRPVMALRARVVAIDGQGRGRLPIGAADGLPTVGGGVLEASLNGSPIAIDRIDITEVVLAPGTAPGDTITLFGDAAHGEQTLQDWADALDTIGEELVVRLTQRIERRTTG
jgi:alanine racemase